MAPARNLPLSPFTCTDVLPTTPQPANDSDPYGDCVAPKKHWHNYLPCGTVLLILAPQPSWLCLLIYFHLQLWRRPGLFITHLLISYTLLFMIFSSFLVCLVRDPGNPSATSRIDGPKVRGPLISDYDTSPNQWCRKCCAFKPERAHHCSICGRCVLKMDRHCFWIGKCIGHRTYPAFVHFLCCVTVLGTYSGIVSGFAFWHSFNNPFIHPHVPVHEMVIISIGMTVFSAIGSLAAYHFYLTSTNQTTIENTSPFLLLRHLTDSRGGHSMSDPPSEHQLSLPQRRLVRGAHDHVLLYNVGFMKNWALTFGCRSIPELLYRLWWGGASPGDGKTFPRNPQSEDMLAKWAKELADLDKDR